jgi:ankyrin repeat protein
MTTTTASNSALFNAITSHDHARIMEALKDIDVNTRYTDGNALLWAITGSRYNQTEPVVKGNYDTVKLLLDHGADPNIVFLVYTPLYNAINEKNDNMVVLLLNYGANINSFYVRVLKEENVCQCRTLLIQAIENHSYLCVEALVKRGALFNNNTLEYAAKIKDETFDKRKQSQTDYVEDEYAEKIHTVLMDAYDPSLEQKVTDFVKTNAMTFKKMNHFVGLEK